MPENTHWQPVSVINIRIFYNKVFWHLSKSVLVHSMCCDVLYYKTTCIFNEKFFFRYWWMVLMVFLVKMKMILKLKIFGEIFKQIFRWNEIERTFYSVFVSCATEWCKQRLMWGNYVDPILMVPYWTVYSVCDNVKTCECTRDVVTQLLNVSI